MFALMGNFRRKPWLILAPAAVLTVVAGLIIGSVVGKSSDTVKAVYQTTPVTRGDLSVDVTGTGSLVAGKTVDLGFSSGGTIESILVKLGDRVEKGEVLATLAEVDRLQNTLEDWQIQLKSAQTALDDLMNGGDKALAQALKDYSAAKETYEEAKKGLHEAGDSRCASSKTEEYYYQYISAQDQVNKWEDYLQYGTSGYGTDYILKALKQMREERDSAYCNMKYCEGYTEQEILQSKADLHLADARLKKRQTVYQDLLSNSGIDSVQVEIARAKVKTAEIQVIKAQNDLEDAVITAPMDGTVVALDAEEGETVAAINKIQSPDETTYTGEFITISDLTTPYLDVNMDETDLENFAKGCNARITFDAIPDRTFLGEVTQIDPVLVSVNGTSMAHGLVEVKNAGMMPGKSLLLGLSGSVDVTCSTVQDALLVPISAWYQSSEGSSYVYVLNESGLPEKNNVEIGLVGTSYVQILDGLNEGDTVVISQVEPD